ncbi:MAG: hypothetical protein Tsb0021_07160 [Chlamydiales bacterium]
MLMWALVFFVIALVAGIFNYTTISSGAMTIARFLFFLFLILFLIALILHFLVVMAIL